jgi:hypothetical protein
MVVTYDLLCWITTILACMLVGLKSLVILLDYRSYMSSSARIWSLRWLFWYLCSYNLDGSVTTSASESTTTSTALGSAWQATHATRGSGRRGARPKRGARCGWGARPVVERSEERVAPVGARGGAGARSERAAQGQDAVGRRLTGVGQQCPDEKKRRRESKLWCMSPNVSVRSEWLMSDVMFVALSKEERCRYHMPAFLVSATGHPEVWRNGYCALNLTPSWTLLIEFGFGVQVLHSPRRHKKTSPKPRSHRFWIDTRKLCAALPRPAYVWPAYNTVVWVHLVILLWSPIWRLSAVLVR